MINSVIFDIQYQETAAADYYNNNVVGGAGATALVLGTPSFGTKTEADTALIFGSFETQITTGTIEAAAVPEPSSLLLLVGGSLAFLMRRKRVSSSQELLPGNDAENELLSECESREPCAHGAFFWLSKVDIQIFPRIVIVIL